VRSSAAGARLGASGLDGHFVDGSVCECAERFGASGFALATESINFFLKWMLIPMKAFCASAPRLRLRAAASSRAGQAGFTLWPTSHLNQHREAFSRADVADDLASRRG
jgi:hypothetical protein